MGSVFSVVKTLIVPAVISLILFILSTYVFLPLWRRYRQRYAQYLPLDRISDRITDRTAGFRQRVQGAITRMLLPSVWRRNHVVAEGSDDDDGFSMDGEELVSQEWHAGMDGAPEDRADDTPRLSRDLEEGFRDDSDDENGQMHDTRVRL